MIVERHYDDETLIGLLGMNLQAVRDPHLAVCSTCSENLASYQAIAEVLGEEVAWELRDLRHEPVPETMAALKSFSATLVEDDAVAPELIATLLATPAAERLAAIRSRRELRTPAVVRALVTESETAIDRDPSQALSIAELATQVAEKIIVDGSAGDAALRARGSAWRQYAYAAFYVGDYRKAEQAVESAATAFDQCLVSDYELARVDIVRGLILAEEERHQEAIETVRRAADVFSAFGDRRRFASARSAEAFSLIFQMRYHEALTILEHVESEYREDLDNEARATVIANVALCQSQVGATADAVNHFQIAAAIYEETGNKPEAARVRYNLAHFLAINGRHAEAKIRFRSVRKEFERLGMLHLAVQVGLDLAEVLLSENAYAEAHDLCTTAIRHFEASGLGHTTAGLTALTFLQEAAARRRATPEVVRHVREYVERLPKEPELLFAPPPLPPI